MVGRWRRKLKNQGPVRRKPLSAYCPNLTDNNHKVESKKTFRYNCVAWAAGFSNKKWGHQAGYFRPDDVDPSPGIEFLVALFASLGFKKCDDGDFEKGFEKVALYAADDEWQHAARQKGNGKWTSKIGDFEDIEHDSPNDVAGGSYGTVVRFMKRGTTRPTRRKSPKR